MKNMQAVVMPQIIFDDISVRSEEYHSDYFIAAPSCDYDSQNRLIRYDDSALNVTYVYTYDNRGNILNYRYMDYVPKDTAVSETGGDTYTYSYTNNVFKDAVTSINGEAITYDSSYNPLKWTNGRTLTWVQGRRLESVTDGSTVTTYTYDENGIRVAKNVSSGGRSTQYYVADGTYLGEKTTYRGVTFLITYLYGDSGVVGIEVNGTKYFFVKNLQGDVTGIIDSTGAVIANYAYDAYGFCYSVTDASGNAITSANHIANLNPFRYRSYMYDTETGFYYLTTRYYDPDVGRFLNADNAVASVGGDINGHNLFAYCFDNPVNHTDEGGNWPKWIKNVANIAKKVVKAVVKSSAKTSYAKVKAVKAVGKNIDATYSHGRSLNLNAGPIAFSVEACVAIDTKGQVDVQVTPTVGLTPTMISGGSITATNTITNAPSVEKTRGPVTNFGGSVTTLVECVPITVAGDYSYIPDEEANTHYDGISINAGIGVPGAEVHGMFGETYSLFTFNVFNQADYAYSKIMEW